MEQVTFESEIQSGAIQPVQQQGAIMMPLEIMDPERAVALFERRNKIMEKFKAIALSVTNELDWIEQGKKMYLQASGVQKVSGTFGISYSVVGYPVKTISRDDLGEFYIYTATVEASHPFLGSIKMDGSASSRDQFFAKRGDEWKKSSEINETNISKKSVTNAAGRAIKALLGLNNLTKEEVNRGYKGTGHGKVEYGSKKTPANNSNGSSSTSTSSTPTSGNPKGDLEEALRAKFDNNEQAMADELERLSSFTNSEGKEFAGKRSVNDLSDKHAARILKDNPELVVPR